MNKRLLILFTVCVFHIGFMKGQDMHFTQFYAIPVYMNPAFAGAGCSRAALVYRNQWPGINTTYKSAVFTADHQIQKYNLGVGIVMGTDAAGTGNLATTVVQPIIAYGLRITKQLALRVAFQPGIGIKGVDFSKLIFGDQLYNQSISASGSLPTTITIPTQSRNYFDLNTGVLLYTPKYWLGASFFHLSNPNQSLYSYQQSLLPVKYTVHGGIKYSFDERETDDFKKKSVSAAFNYYGQQNFSQLDIGFYYTQYLFNVGLWYRGIPIVQGYAPGYANNDAIAIIIGFQNKTWSFGYSYDITISQLSGYTNGAQELTLSYQFCSTKKKKPKFGLMLPCPKF